MYVRWNEMGEERKAVPYRRRERGSEMTEEGAF